MSVKSYLYLVVLFGLCGSTNVNPCYAQFETDSAAPIEITADSMEWLNEKKIAIARGNADAIQGRYTLRAQVLTAHITEDSGNEQESNSQISLIEAEGDVLLITPTEEARGNTGTYDVRRKTATLIGSVILTQGDNVLHGEKLVMNLVTGHSRLDGDRDPTETNSSGRVKAIFNPETAEQR